MSQYITDLKKCRDCGEVKPVSEFYSYGGQRPGYRQPFKECLNAHKRANYANSGYSPCTNCPKLDECRELLRIRPPQPQPCDNGFQPPKPAYWDTIKVLEVRSKENATTTTET